MVGQRYCREDLNVLNALSADHEETRVVLVERDRLSVSYLFWQLIKRNPQGTEIEELVRNAEITMR